MSVFLESRAVNMSDCQHKRRTFLPHYRPPIIDGNQVGTAARGGQVGLGTARVRFSMVSLGFFIDTILPAAL